MIFFFKQKLDEVEKYNIWALEWMSVNVLSGLMPNKQFLSYIMVKNRLYFYKMMMIMSTETTVHG